MTAIPFNTAPRMAAVTSKLQVLLRTLGDALDAFAEYRMQRAVPEAEILRTEREIGRYRQFMRAGR
jgi:hypothetical protein